MNPHNAYKRHTIELRQLLVARIDSLHHTKLCTHLEDDTMDTKSSKKYSGNNCELETLIIANDDTQPKEKKIDFVLVYNDTVNDEIRGKRERYEANLQKRGLLLETKPLSKVVSLEVRSLHFVIKTVVIIDYHEVPRIQIIQLYQTCTDIRPVHRSPTLSLAKR